MNAHSHNGGIVIALLTFGLAAAGPVCAQDAPPSYAEQALRKLGRGIANVATCPAELVRIPVLVGRRDGYLPAMTVGILQGAWKGLVRGVAGLYEVVTFYAETPKDFRPVVTPEFVWVHGDWAE